ncbi:MAG: hypothetical protein MZW92_52895 [Comamonadaceae bacterium]|nr:hypothetical protein [Comamonadaceae bacterium]
MEIIDRVHGPFGNRGRSGEFYRMGLEYTLNNPMRVLYESMQDVLRVFSPLDRNGRINPVLFIALPFIICGMYLVWKHDADAGAVLGTDHSFSRSSHLRLFSCGTNPDIEYRLNR